MIKVLLYCYFPFFESHLGGGVQVWIRKLVEKLDSYSDISLSIICPRSTLHPMYESENVFPVLDDLEINGITPSIYKENMDKISSFEKKADIIWTIDREFPIRTTKPFLLSLNTICYEREIKSFFNNPWSSVFVVSEFEKAQIISCTERPANIKLAPIFIDSVFERKKLFESKERLKRYFVYDNNCKYILFPHRPEAEKGVYDALNILKEIINKDKSFRLLIPRQPDSKVADLKKESAFLRKVEQEVDEQELSDYVIFHDWIEYGDLPYYYSIGFFTLFLSTLPETFGVTLIQSIACCTPVISYGTGALLEVVPPGNGHRIVSAHDYGKAAEIILNPDSIDVKEDRDYVFHNYNIDKIVSLYHDELICLQGDK